MTKLPSLTDAKQERTKFALVPRSRQKERTLTTRRKLLGAAERIFAQNGFEAARLEDIAARAGYTRGAFYANFKSKEDIFFALLEDWVRERIESVTNVLGGNTDPIEKLAALRKYYAEIAWDRRVVLISMEFKLYALRHPEAHARLRSCHRRIRASLGQLYSELACALGRTLPIAGAGVSAGLGAAAQGLLLEHLVDPKTLSDADLRHSLGLIFDALFQASPSNPREGAGDLSFERNL